MKKKKLILLIIGLLLNIIPQFINVYTIYRLFSVLVGLIIIQVALIIDKKDKVWRTILFPIIFLILSFAIDYGIVHIFNRVPIYATRIKSSNEVTNYNSLFYRIYSCDNKLIIDNLYKKEYLCSKKSIEKIDVTSFLNNVIENYKDYKDKFVKLEGKISKVNGTYNLELQGYTLTEESINGYVLFSDNVTLEVNFNEITDLTTYKVYDSITLIGRIDELIKKGSYYTIKMQDSIILNSDLYETFELSIVEKNKCGNDRSEYAKIDELTYYTSCLDNVYVKYNAENVYDLSYVLIDKKMNLKSLVSKAEEKIEENNNILYKFEKFNILECSNKTEVIIGNRKLKIDSPYCEAVDSNTEEEL